jgi:hypothetical protein
MCSEPAQRPRGQTIILMVLILAVIAGFLVFQATGNRVTNVDRNKRTEAALAQAREALMGRALADPNHPGSMPCPDVNDDGQLTLNVDYVSGGACAQNIGRLPWKTLGLPDLRDGDGERLWYMLSPAFQDAGNPINTNTLSNLTVYAGNNTNVLATQVVAVVFAPGAPVGNQARSSTQTAACGATGTTIAQSLCANNYLETLSGINNASPTGPFITGAPNPTFNDRLALIGNIELMTPIEARAAQAILSALQDYRAGSTWICDCYPFADTGNGTAEWGNLEGLVPLVHADWDAPFSSNGTDWGDMNPPVVIPQWLLDNDWRKVFFYTVASARTIYHGSGWLTMNGVSGKGVVLISTGAATAPRSAMPSDYVDDPENADEGVVFITPTDTTSMNRDRLYILP